MDRRPQKARATLSRPGRRLFAAGPRPARPRRRCRRPPPRPRPGPRHLQPRQRLVRPGPLARAGRTVLRCPRSARETESNRFGHRRGSSRRPGPTPPAWRSGWSRGWPASSAGNRKASPEHRSADDSSSTLSARFQGARGEVSVRIITRAVPTGCPAMPSDRRGNHQDAGHSRATRAQARPFGSSGRGPARRLSWSRPRRADSGRLPRGIDAPELDAARRIATALESSRIDIPFRNALPIALWLLEPAEPDP